MAQYLIRRLFQTVFVIIGVTAIAFFAQFLTGDPTFLLLGETRGMTQEQIDQIRHDLGFDRPVYVQYLDWLGKAAQGDLGKSLRHGTSNFELVMERMPATLQLTFTALLISIIIALPVGIIAAVKRDTWIDRTVMIGAMWGQSVPNFWLGYMLILIFGVWLRWLPVSGRGSWQHLIMPAIALSLFSIARNSRMVRSSMLEVLGADYVRTARAKGIRENTVVLGHAFRNALIPVVTLVALDFGGLLGGAVIVETIFAWPGVGRLIINAIQGKDFPLVQAGVTLLAMSFVLINLAVDLMYTRLDPRVRLGARNT